MSRAVPKDMYVETNTVEAPSDLMTLTALAAEFPGVGLRLIRRVAYERRCRVFRFAGKTLVSRADFSAYLASGVENARA